MKTIINSLIVGIVLVIGISLNSCRATTEEIIYEGNQTLTTETDQTLKSCMDIMMETVVVVDNMDSIINNGMKKTAIANASSTNVTPVIADLQFVDPSINVNPASIRTYGDMYEMQSAYGVDFYVMEEEPVGRQVVILVSEEESLRALQPMIDKCKNYLYRKGFSEFEIDEMLVENNVSPAALIPLVLALGEDEENFEAEDMIIGWSTSTRGESYKEKILPCLAKALGADVITMLISEAPNTNVHQWTKTAIKLLLKKIAPKIFGTIGWIILSFEYYNCMTQ